MKENDGLWEYIVVYVNDLCIALKSPEKITKTLVENYGFKLKGIRQLAFHLGCDFKRVKMVPSIIDLGGISRS